MVAAEVRKLAERSQASAAEMSRVSSSSVTIAEEADQLLRAVVPDIRKTATLVREINTASQEQNHVAAQINQAIQQLDELVQQNAAGAEELSATASELTGQGHRLVRAVAFFEVEDAQDELGEPRRPAAMKPAPTKSRGVEIDLGPDLGDGFVDDWAEDRASAPGASPELR